MTDEQIAELIEKARKATPGPWFVFTHMVGDPHGDVCVRPKSWDWACDFPAQQKFIPEAEFIAAANPATVIQLCEQLRRYREALEWYAHSSNYQDCEVEVNSSVPWTYLSTNVAEDFGERARNALEGE